MKLPTFFCAVAAVIVSLSATGGAADETLKPAPVPAVTEAPKVFAPTDLESLRAVIGQPAAVEGTIIATGESKSKTVRYLNFTKSYKESLGLVFFVSKGAEEFTLEKLTAWVGKKIRATGKVAEHNGTLQIEIEKWEQVQEIP